KLKNFDIISRTMIKKPELILPGGDLPRTKIALDFGADAVYVGLNKYSLRKGEVRFDIHEIGEAIEYAHSLGKKIYVTFNIFAHNEHLKGIEKDMKKIATLNPDAFIMADIGVIQIAKRIAPKVPIHISTQANTTNIEDVRFWRSIGAKRVVLARELTLKEITEIHKAAPEIELEVFTHGSMCIAYSGRCLLSNYMTSRHSNLGDCAQPCRWNYRVAQVSNDKFQVLNRNSKLKNESKFKIQNSKFFLEESQRPGEYFEIEEMETGTNIMSSKDLCTIEYIDKMIEAGVTGFKIEGRNKTDYYLAATTIAYREAINLAIKKKYTPKEKNRLKKELGKIAHRNYTTGFLFGDAKKGETYQGRSPIEIYRYIGIVKEEKGKKERLHTIIVKNKIRKNMDVEILTPSGLKKDKILRIFDQGFETNEISPGRENQAADIILSKNHKKDSILRAK
ncbi:MAG: U32 family peptidase C-terminal domain-containing protein, partial [Patescibacteria group bacterium]|nr:U32 family peptidase C-terminal domain-containing protein [Patescibacteria group bacterium]